MCICVRGRVSELVHQRDGTPLARLLLDGRDGNRMVRAGDFVPIRPGCIRRRGARDGRDGGPWRAGIDYWALGGRHDRSTLFSSPQMAHYAGSPQGRRPDEAGAHGCTLVQVDETARRGPS